MDFASILKSAPAWLLVAGMIFIIITLVILVLTKTNVSLGRLSIVTKQEIKESNNNELRLTIFTEIRAYETDMDNIESFIFCSLVGSLREVSIEEKNILNHFASEIRYKLENKLMIDIVANNFRDLKEEDLQLYILNKSQKYCDFIIFYIVDSNDSILPNKDFTGTIQKITIEKLQKHYNNIYRSIIASITK